MLPLLVPLLPSSSPPPPPQQVLTLSFISLSGVRYHDAQPVFAIAQESDSLGNPGVILVSFDYGYNWRPVSAFQPAMWRSIALNADGSILVATAQNQSALYVSGFRSDPPIGVVVAAGAAAGVAYGVGIGTGVPVNYVIMQCTNAAQVVARGGTLSATGGCVAARTQSMSSSMPIVDSQSGGLQIKNMAGNDYIKVYDAGLNATMWKVWDPSSSQGSMKLLMPVASSGPRAEGMMASSSQQMNSAETNNNGNAVSTSSTGVLPKLGGVVSSNQGSPVSTDAGNHVVQTGASNITAATPQAQSDTTSSMPTVSAAPRITCCVLILCAISITMIFALLW